MTKLDKLMEAYMQLEEVSNVMAWRAIAKAGELSGYGVRKVFPSGTRKTPMKYLRQAERLRMRLLARGKK